MRRFIRMWSCAVVGGALILCCELASAHGPVGGDHARCQSVDRTRCQAAEGRVRRVSSASALTSELGSAHSGDTILLQAGTYSGLSLSNLNFGSGVTIASADKNNQAVLTNFDMTGVTGLKFQNLTFNVTTPAYAGFNVTNSHNITLDGVSVHGSLDGDSSNDAEGFRFFDSDHVTITGSTFQQVAKAAQFSNVTDIVVSNNNVHDVMSNGFVFAQVANVHIDNNVIHDIKPVNGLHPDGIQFTTSNTTVASHDIEISRNLIYRGNGDYFQGIFMRDEVGSLPFQNATISGNTIVGTGWSAIYTTHNVGLTITGNNLVSFVGDNDTRMTIQGADQVVVTNNSAGSLASILGFDSSDTNVSQSGNSVNEPASDHGNEALRQWYASRPSRRAVN
jgi:hypothetical protein